MTEPRQTYPDSFKNSSPSAWGDQGMNAFQDDAIFPDPAIYKNHSSQKTEGQRSWRSVFFGSCAFSRTVLDIFAPLYPPVALITAPNKPKGRHKNIEENPVQAYGRCCNIPTYTPSSLRCPEITQHIHQLNVDVLIVASYGLIIPQAILDLAPWGGLNVHPSMLPRWRGASPVQYTIWHGDDQAGISLMRMNAGMDQGPLLWQRSVPLQGQEEAPELSQTLAKMGAQALLHCFPLYMTGQMIPQNQRQEDVTIAHKLTKEDGVLRWEDHAASYCVRTILAMNPWPKTRATLGHIPVILWKGMSAPLPSFLWPHAPGTLLWDKTQEILGVVAKDRSLFLPQCIQPLGGKKMSAPDFMRGHSIHLPWIAFSYGGTDEGEEPRQSP